MNWLVTKCALLLLAVVFFTATQTMAADMAVGNEAPVATSQNPETNQTAVSDVVKAFVEVQAQLHAAQLALERNQQAAEAAGRNAQELADQLQSIEKAMNDQRMRDLAAIQSGNRIILSVAGTFVGLGFLVLLVAAYFQWRGIGRLTEIAFNNRLAGQWQLPPIGSSQLAVESTVDNHPRLLNVIDRLEKRIQQLEHTAHPPVSDSTPPPEVVASKDSLATDKTARITLLLGKGQSLLNLDKADEAIACFDEVLTLDSNNPDALVKKGVGLERQRKLNEAIECYDRAIAADSSVTIAYLYKGGVFNRLERFDEALQCYEQALRVQEHRA